ncbi:MAG: hypothetical protein ACOX9B_03720 [Candidatus Xenobium sp.]|nr:hypothetical protein [Burkholderiales bacterium]
MEDLLTDMPALNHGFLLAVPANREEVHHHLADSLPCPTPARPKVRTRTVACGFPQQRLRVTVRMDRLRKSD